MEYAGRMMLISAFCCVTLGVALAAGGSGASATSGRDETMASRPSGTGSLNYRNGGSGRKTTAAAPSAMNANGPAADPRTPGAAPSTPGLSATNQAPDRLP
jgi:hypothetical protein